MDHLERLKRAKDTYNRVTDEWNPDSFLSYWIPWKEGLVQHCAYHLDYYLRETGQHLSKEEFEEQVEDMVLYLDDWTEGKKPND